MRVKTQAQNGPFKTQPRLKHRNAFAHKTNNNIEFLRPYPVVEADALPEIGTAVILAVLSLDKHL
jgi:hypothetical protein